MNNPESGRRSRMRASAQLRTELASDGRGRPCTRLSTLRSEAPLKLRPIAHTAEPYVIPAAIPGRVCLAASAAGPMGGDHFTLEVEVGAGSTLVLTEASATLLLPGVGRARSRTDVRVRVETGGTMVWLPEPIIAARDCHHRGDVAIDLIGDARLLMREELLLGRRDEDPGSLHQQLRIRRGDQTLLAQQLRIGDGQEAGPAIVGTHRAVGSTVVVDPDLVCTDTVSLGGDGVLLPLAAGHAVLGHGLADDSITLRRQHEAALAAIGAPWGRRSVGRRPTSLEEAG